MDFALGQHVMIRNDRNCFGGVTGTIADPPEWLEDDDGGNRRSTPARNEKRRNGTVVVYWVEFDQPTEDTAGGESYLAAAIEAEALQPVGDPLTQGAESRQPMHLVC